MSPQKVGGCIKSIHPFIYYSVWGTEACSCCHWVEMRPTLEIYTDDCGSCLLVGDGGFVRRGLEPPLVVGASQIRQGASLLEPATQRRLDVVVDVPVEEMAVNATPKTRLA